MQHQQGEEEERAKGLQSCTHRYMGGGLPSASQLNTTSRFFSTFSTGYTMLPGCLVKTGLCRTLLSVGQQGKTKLIHQPVCQAAN